MAVNGGFERTRQVATGHRTVTYDARAECCSKIIMNAFSDRGTKPDGAVDTSSFACIGVAACRLYLPSIYSRRKSFF